MVVRQRQRIRSICDVVRSVDGQKTTKDMKRSIKVYILSISRMLGRRREECRRDRKRIEVFDMLCVMIVNGRISYIKISFWVYKQTSTETDVKKTNVLVFTNYIQLYIFYKGFELIIIKSSV